MSAVARQASAPSGGYRRKVYLLAALGYGFVLLLVLVLLAVAAGLVWVVASGHVLGIKLLIPTAALLWLIARSLWVRIEPPGGVEVDRRTAPELHRMIDEVREAVRGPRVHRVLLDPDANAGVVQIPRAGGLLGSTNYLVLGLPYLQALSPEQLRAVVAHELGHLSRRHGRFGAFVYSVRARWAQLLGAFEARRSIWTGVVRAFFSWYVPYFTAVTLPVARAHEFEADAAAAEVAGPDAAAAALVAGLLAARWLGDAYWPRLLRRADAEASPPAAVFSALAPALAEAKSYGNVRRWYRELLAAEEEEDDTHPSLAQRLERLGADTDAVLAEATRLPERSAADAYLGAAAARLAADVDRLWNAVVAPAWHGRYGEARGEQDELRRLDARAAELSDDEALRRAQLTEVHGGEEAAVELYRGMLGGANAAAAAFAIGRILLERGDEAGLAHLDAAADADPEAVLPACELAYAYLAERGRDEEAERYRERGERQLELLLHAEVERAQVSVEDELEPPSLPAEQVERITRKVAWYDEIERAYLVRKRTEHLDDTHPFHVLAVVPKSSLKTAWREADDDAEPLEERVARDVRDPSVMVVKVGKKSPLAQRFAAVAGAELVSR